ncbi:MAG: hypothetical protein KY476_18885 [Planctomycetes bacterium]|nr:hypothetical protein [Planctomycetota bacterium]
MAVLETSARVAAAIEDVFGILARPAEAAALSPPEMQVVLVEAPEVISAGSRVTFEVSAYGFKQRFVHEIVECLAPTRIAIVQAEGPFRAFRHEKLLITAAGETLLSHRIEFEPPGGLLGFLLTEQRLLEQLQASLAHEHAALQRRLERAG